MPSLSCLLPLPLGIVVRVHLLSLSWAGVGCQGSLEQGILQGNCFYYTTLDGSVDHPSASNEQGTRLIKRKRSNQHTCSAECSVLHWPQTGASFSLYLGPWRNHWVFSVNSVQSVPFLEKIPVSKYAGHFRSRCGWAHIQELRTSSHRTFSVVSGHSTVQIK